MKPLDKDYYRAANKGQFKYGVWAVENEEPAEGILHGDIEERTWTVTKMLKGGVKSQQVRSRQDWAIKDGYMETGNGTSLHDYEGALDYRSWDYFRLPEGTEVPAMLLVNQRGADPHHYQIEVRTGGVVSPDALRGALDNLARNCVVRLKQLADQDR